MSNSDIETRLQQAVDGRRMFQYVAGLSQFERMAGTAGEERAAQYLVETLKVEGLPVQVSTFDSYASLPVHASLEVLGPVTWTSRHVVTHSFAADTGEGAGLEGEVVFIPGPDRLEFPTETVNGKILLAEGLAMPGRVWAGERAGAIAQIYAGFDQVPHDLIVTTVWGGPSILTADQYPTTPIVSINVDEGEMLKSLVATHTGVRVRLHTRVITGWRRQYLPSVRVEPNRAATPYLLVGGHYCSWYGGATDNATGDAALIELAVLLHANREHLRRGVVFAWWPGHTHGRYSGSTWYCDHFWDDLKDRCVAYFNIDSPGVRLATIYRPTVMAEAEGWLKDVIRDVAGQEVSVRRPGKLSDESFWGIGFPSWCIYTDMPEGAPTKGHVAGSGGGWFWHTPHDTLDKVDPEQLVVDARLFAACILRLLNAPVLPYRPTWLARDVATALNEIAGLPGSLPRVHDLQSAAYRLAGAAARLEHRLDALGREGRVDPSLDQILMGLSREINPVLYTRNGRYEQDLATPTLLFPALREAKRYSLLDPASHDARVLKTYLVRQANRTHDALRRGTELIEDALVRT